MANSTISPNATKTDLLIPIRNIPGPFQAFMLSWFSFDNNLISDYPFHKANYGHFQGKYLNQPFQADSSLALYLGPLDSPQRSVTVLLSDLQLIFMVFCSSSSQVSQTYKVPLNNSPTFQSKTQS